MDSVKRVLGIFVTMVSTSVAADLDAGRSWLESRAAPNGAFFSSSIASEFQAAAEALAVIEPGALSEATLDYLLAQPYSGTEHLARVIIAAVRAGTVDPELLAELLGRQNPDGGFGELEGYASTALDTAWAAMALGLADDQNAAGRAVQFLLETQAADGGWLPNDTVEPRLVSTSLAASALWLYRHDFELGAALAIAENFLLGYQETDALWDGGNEYVSSRIILSLLALNPDRAGLHDSVNALLSRQAGDGSFAQDVYITALALRAIESAQTAHPDLASVQGRVIDAETGLPLAHVRVTPQQSGLPPVFTTTEGSFRFDDVAVGSFSVELARSAYLGTAISTHVGVGEQFDFGELRLRRDPAAGQGNLRGRITDLATGLPIAGAMVDLHGVGQVHTDDTGQYQFAGLAQGQMTVGVAAEGYTTRLAAVTIPSNGISVYSISLSTDAPPASGMLLAGQVTARASGEPIAGATVSLSGASANSTSTDENGFYEVAGATPGRISVRVAAPGFATALNVFEARDASRHDYSPALLPDGSTAPPGAVVSGQLVDAGTGEPVAGVTVRASSAHEFWRLHVTDAGTFHDRLVLYELELREDIGGQSVAVGGTPISSPWDPSNAVPENAFDGQNSAVWRTDGFLPAFIGYDFPEPVRIQEYVLHNSLHSSAPISWELQHSHDGVDWQMADSQNAQVFSDFDSRNYLVDDGHLAGTSDSEGRFELRGMLGPEISLQFHSADYESTTVALTTATAEVIDIGTVHLVPADRRKIQADLVVAALDVRSRVETDLQALTSQGQADLVVSNTGAATASGFKVSIFLDRNGDRLLSPALDTVLGEGVVSQTLSPGESASLTVPISGSRAFRDDALAAFVDSAETVPELNEINNVRFVTQDCVVAPGIDTFSAHLKWNRSEYSHAVAPLVGPLLDSNADGRFDANDTPVVLVMGYTGLLPDRSDGILAAYNGSSGSLLWTAQSPAMWAGTTPAIGDLDGDGVPEIIGIAQQGGVQALRPDGSLKWQGEIVAFQSFPTNKYGQVALADLDGDGLSEIVVGPYAFSHQGDLLWHGTAAGSSLYGSMPVDLDLDGDLEIVDGNAAFDHTGSLLWQNTEVPRSGRTAIADLLGGPRPEIVVADLGRVYLLSADGELIWQRYVPAVTPYVSQHGGGTPAIGDIDADGELEIVVGHSATLTSLSADRTIEWSIESRDGSALASPTLFDFDGDGDLEVAFIDEVGLRVVDGLAGDVLFANSDRSTTASDVPVVADVDGDGHAELLHANHLGLLVYEDGSDRWLPATTIWNQHNYHGINIRPDAAIPQSVLAPNARYESFHSGMVENPLGAPDATVARILLEDRGAGQLPDLTARVGNGGFLPIDAPLPLQFFAVDHADQTTLLGEVVIAPLVPGQYLDATLVDVAIPAEATRIRAIVDPANLLIECDELNNVHEAEAVAAQAQAALVITTDAPAYAPGASAILNAEVTNTGSLPATFDVEFLVVDADDRPVAAFELLRVGSLTGQGSTVVSQSWNPPTLIAGSYRAIARLLDSRGALVTDAETPLEILPTTALRVSLRTTTDQAEYHSTDRIRLRHLARNLSANAPVSEARLEYWILDDAGQVQASGVSALGELPAGALRELENAHAIEAWAEGNYTIQSEMLDGAGQILATAAASFSIAEDPSAALSGTVDTALNEVHRRDPQTCTDTIRNAGTATLVDLPIRQRVVNLSNGEAAETAEISVTVPAGGSTTVTREIATHALSEGDYSCAVEAQIDGVWAPLAYASFTVLPPRIEIAAELDLGERGRVLALMDRRNAPGNLGPACDHGLFRAQFESEFDPPLSPDATVTVTVTGLAGQVLDVETRQLLAGDGEVNANFAGTPVDLSIPAFSSNGLLVALTGETIEETLGEQYLLIADLHDHSRTLQLSSGLLDAVCNPLQWTRNNTADLLQLSDVEVIEDPAQNGRFGDGDDRRSIADQRQQLRALLQQSAWRSTIVDRATTFSAALRSGEYDIYLLLAEYEVLSETDQKLLRELVYGGAGLVVAGRYDERSRILDDALGLKYKGTHLHPQGLNLSASAVHPGGSASFRENSSDDDVQRIRTEGAAVLGTVETTADPDHPGLVTFHEYGRGRAIHVGFDLLAEMSAPNAAELFGELLVGATAAVDRDQSDLRAGRSLPLRLSLKNLGIATDGQVTLSSSTGEFVDTSVGSIGPADTLLWPFSLAEEEQLAGDVWLQTPFDGAELSIEARVESIDGSQRDLQASPQLSLTPAVEAGLSQAIAELEALIAQRQPGPLSGILGLVQPTALDQALAHLRSAEQHRNAGQRTDAETELLLAADDLIAAGTPDINTVRRYLGTTLRQIGTEISP